jgi:hypothetical protein
VDAYSAALFRAGRMSDAIRREIPVVCADIRVLPGEWCRTLGCGRPELPHRLHPPTTRHSPRTTPPTAPSDAADGGCAWSRTKEKGRVRPDMGPPPMSRETGAHHWSPSRVSTRSRHPADDPTVPPYVGDARKSTARSAGIRGAFPCAADAAPLHARVVPAQDPKGVGPVCFRRRRDPARPARSRTGTATIGRP